jgi:hypothetical protein
MGNEGELYRETLPVAVLELIDSHEEDEEDDDDDDEHDKDE